MRESIKPPVEFLEFFFLFALERCLVSARARKLLAFALAPA